LFGFFQMECYDLSVSLPPNSYVEALTPQVMGLEGSAFGRWLGDKGRTLVNGIRALIKALERLPLHTTSAMGGHRKKAVSEGQMAQLPVL
jgi:hypothetical protein